MGRSPSWLFLGSEVMFFTGLIGAYIVLRFGQPDGQLASTPKHAQCPVDRVEYVPADLLKCHAGVGAPSDPGRQPPHRELGPDPDHPLFGATFVGVQAYEYYELWIHRGLTPSTNIFGSCFYAMTGFHGLHVALGVVAMAVVTVMGLKGKFNPKSFARSRADRAVLAFCRPGLDYLVRDCLPGVIQRTSTADNEYG